MICSAQSSATTPLDVFVMEVDMSGAGESGCRACDTTTARVKESIDQIRPMFDALGVEVRVDKLLVRSDAEARALGLRASPMIRIGGMELAPEHRDDGASDGQRQTTRVWHWRGQSYNDPPIAMLLDTFLRAYATLHSQDAVSDRAGIPAYVQQYLAPERAKQSTNACGSGCS